MSKGRIVGEFDPRNTTREQLMVASGESAEEGKERIVSAATAPPKKPAASTFRGNQIDIGTLLLEGARSSR